MMKATTMTLSEKRQSVFPQDWCERVGLARGGQVNVFDLGEHGLLIRPVKSPTRRELAAALAAARPRRSKPGEAERIVARALRKVRFTCLSLNGRYALGGGGDNAAVRRALARRAYEKHR